MDNYTYSRETSTEEIDALFCKELEDYKKDPCPACSKQQAKKLLKRYNNTEFSSFWYNPIKQYLPLISAGYMKTGYLPYSHDEAMKHARALVKNSDIKYLARAYLYGIAHAKPEYCTALASYFYIKNLPDHSFEQEYLGKRFSDGVDVYSDYCALCRYDLPEGHGPKMQFFWINHYIASFYLTGQIVGFYFDLNKAILCLEEFSKLPIIKTEKSDFEFFMHIIKSIDFMPDNYGLSKIKASLKKSNALRLTSEQLDAFLDMLGYLNIMHPSDCFGVIYKHTRPNDMKERLHFKSYSSYPVNRWKKSDGIDYKSIEFLFGDCYN